MPDDFQDPRKRGSFFVGFYGMLGMAFNGLTCKPPCRYTRLLNNAFS